MDKIQDIIDTSVGIQSNVPYFGYTPSIKHLLMILYGNTEWKKETPADLWSLLGAMQEYAFKYRITDFYEMVLRFTLSECFDEEY